MYIINYFYYKNMSYGGVRRSLSHIPPEQIVLDEQQYTLAERSAALNRLLNETLRNLPPNQRTIEKIGILDNFFHEGIPRDVAMHLLQNIQRGQALQQARPQNKIRGKAAYTHCYKPRQLPKNYNKCKRKYLKDHPNPLVYPADYGKLYAILPGQAYQRPGYNRNTSIIQPPLFPGLPIPYPPAPTLLAPPAPLPNIPNLGNFPRQGLIPLPGRGNPFNQQPISNLENFDLF